jgi:hemerythrin-like domain-containing protein
MKALKILRDEHALIRQYLDNLALASEKLERGERPPKEFFEKAVDFSRQFVDKHHHFKEEHIIFTWLAQRKKGGVRR